MTVVSYIASIAVAFARARRNILQSVASLSGVIRSITVAPPIIIQRFASTVMRVFGSTNIGITVSRGLPWTIIFGLSLGVVIIVLSWGIRKRKKRAPVKIDLPPEAPPELPPEPARAIRVLHVDDEPDHLMISKRFLEKFDSAIQVVSVSSPEEALQKAETFDVVVSDYQMPGMNGIELARRIREKTDNPIIIYTGQGSEEVASSAFEAGTDDYLKKEFGPSHYQLLVKRVRMTVERHRAEVARSLLEEQNAVTLEILQILNREEDSKNALLAVISKIKQYTGMEALAIRLYNVDDYPYYVWNGFPDYFVKMESSLCSRNHGGEPLRNEDGSPVLECMCGNVIRGRFDSSLPFFTEGGSFWTNCTSELLASTTEEDRQARTRNTCNGEGYETVVLIPLRNKTETIGLLQLNDKHMNKVSLQMVQFLERLAESIGTAMVRVNVPKDYLVNVMDSISEESPTVST